MRVVILDPDCCVGCRNCEYACAFKKSGDFDCQRSNIRVTFYAEERACIPWTCCHCTEGWCLEVCPAEAIWRNPDTGAVEIDLDRCVGCKLCMLVCPMGSIRFDIQDSVCRKCDLCQGDPACVKFCISGALKFLEPEEVSEDCRRRYAFKIIGSQMKGLGSGQR